MDAYGYALPERSQSPPDGPPARCRCGAEAVDDCTMWHNCQTTTCEDHLVRCEDCGRPWCFPCAIRMAWNYVDVPFVCEDCEEKRDALR